MQFTKMQGCGNDYIFIDRTKIKYSNKSRLALKMSDRHFGVGSDGLIFIEKSLSADFKMDFYNKDGTAAEMCGTAARCLAKYVYDNGLTDNKEVLIETPAGIKKVKLQIKSNKVIGGTVSMGGPIFDCRKININLPLERVFEYPLMIDENTYFISVVSMGNPHAVIFCGDINKIDVNDVGQKISAHPLFPKGINVEFISAIKDEILMRVYERGAGETLSCGTGSAAAVVVASELSRCSDKTRVYTKGGSLLIYYDKEHSEVYLTGQAKTVFTGETS